MKHILIVDDDALMLSLMSRALPDFQLTVARDGDEALAIASQLPVDLLITDYLMPSMTGDELIGHLRERRPNLKVLFASGYADLSRFGGNLGNHALLKKPFRLETLAEAVQTALQRASAGEPDNIVQLRRDQL